MVCESKANRSQRKERPHNKDNQVKELKDYIINWDGKKNLILVTHYVVISEILNVSTSSGEIVITDQNFNILTSINTSNN